MKKLLSVRLLAFALAAMVLSAPVFAGEMKVSSGVFSGASDHVTAGGVSVIERDGDMILVLGADFSLDGAPDPKLGFGLNGKYDGASKVAHLKSKTGAQEYMIPEGVDVSQYNEIYVWCEKYSVPLGVAMLK